MTAPLLDTHAWLWWMSRDARLGASAVAALDACPPTDRPVLCDISLWEAAMLVERGRITLTEPFEAWLEAASHPRTVRIQPVTARIAVEVARLPPKFHRDPADRLIVATARVLGTAVVTSDRLIRRSKLVRVWQPPKGSRPAEIRSRYT